MRTLFAFAAVCFVAGCGPRDPNKVLVNEEFEIAPKQFAYKKFTLDLGGTYAMNLTPKGGNLEVWVEAGETAPIVIYVENMPLPKAKVFSDGKEDSLSGTLGWGGANLIVCNRSGAPIKAKCKLTVLPNGPK